LWMAAWHKCRPLIAEGHGSRVEREPLRRPRAHSVSLTSTMLSRLASDGLQKAT
jgi:hypothetical protein